MFENLPFFNKKQKSPTRHNFNLLRPAQIKLSFIDKVYLWMSGTCRLLIIFIELSVIGSLGYRFVIDRSANDLKSEVAGKVEYLEQFSSKESLIRNYDAKINLYDNVRSLSPIKVKIIPQLYGITNKLSRFDLVLTSTDLTISGQGERTVIEELENALKTSENFKDVTVTSLNGTTSSSGGSKSEFSIHALIVY